MEITKRVPIKIPIRVTSTDKCLDITLVRRITDKDLIKMILYQALYKEPLVSYPYFACDDIMMMGILSTAELVKFDLTNGKCSWGNKLK